MIDTQTISKPIRTNVMRFIQNKELTVAKFRTYAKRTRLKDTNNLLKIDQHYSLWVKYGWV